MSKTFVEIKNLSKQFLGITVLENVNMNFNHNEIVGMVGENGAGKSTLMNALCGIFTDWSGEILLDGRSIRPGNTKNLTRTYFNRHIFKALVTT